MHNRHRTYHNGGSFHGNRILCFEKARVLSPAAKNNYWVIFFWTFWSHLLIFGLTAKQNDF